MAEDASEALAGARSAKRTEPGGRRVAENFGWLLTGRAVTALINLAALSLMARALSLEAFGLVLLLNACALMLRQIFSLHLGDAVVMYGVALLEGRRSADWSSLLGALFRLDALAALPAGAMAALLLLAGPALLADAGIFRLEQSLQDASWCYVAALLVPANGTANGSLMALNRYRLLGALPLAGPLLRLAGIAMAAQLGLQAHWYVAVWALALALNQLLVLAAAALVLLRRREAPNFRRPLRQTFGDYPGSVSFVKTIYWQANLDQLPQHTALLLVGGLFGADSAGLFRYVRDLGEALRKPVVLLRNAIFPDLSSLWRKDRRAFSRLAWRVSLGMIALGGLFVLAALGFGSALLTLLAGEPFAAGATLLAMLLGAAALDLGGAVLRPTSYAMGRARQVLRIQLAATALYFAALLAASGSAGLEAAGWAALLGAAFSLAGVSWLVWQAQRAAEHG